MGAYSSVACAEVFGTFTESADVQSGLNFQVGLHCAATDRFDLMEDLLTTPRYYPNFSGFPVYACTCSCVPLPGDATGGAASANQLWNYTGDALVTVNYSTIIAEIASESIEPCIENTPLDYRMFNWGGTSAPVMLTEGEAPSLLMRGLTLVRTRYRLSAIPNDVLAATGSVNLADYSSTVLGVTFPAGTLQYLPAVISRSFSSFTDAGYTLTMKFAYRPADWNKQFRATTNQYEYIYLNGSNTPYKPLPPYDYSTLLS